MTNWSTTTKHEPSSINNGRRYELRDRVSIEQLNNMTENSFYAMEASSVAKEKAEEALKFAQGSGTTVYENGSPVAEFNADKKVDVAELENYYTKGQVDALIESGGSADVDLSNYYTKQETYSKQEVDDKLANLDVDIDFSDYYTKSQTDSLLSAKVDKLELGNYVTTENLENRGYLTEVPSEYVTETELTAKGYATTSALNSGLNEKADKSEIPNVSQFITRSVEDLVNYYTKAQTYTQAEVRQLISAIPKFNIEVITGFPTSNISETTIYLLRATTGESGNLYSEYIYVNGIWEKLGEQKLDLSGYVTTDALNTALSKYYTKSNVDSLLTSKADKTELPDVSNFITKDVDNLTNYYKKTETYTKTETQNLLDLGLNTKADKSALDNYVTDTGLETTLASKGYLTEDDLDGYATESSVQTSISNLDSGLRGVIGTKADASALEELDNEVNNVSYNLSTVRNSYLKSVNVSDDGKTLQIYDQNNKATLFSGGGTEYTAGNGISINNGVISGVSIKQLWVNDRPGVSNPSRDITLTSNDYDFLLFIYGSYYVNLEYENSVICKKGNNAVMESLINYSSSPYVGIVSRTMIYVNDTTYNIDSCYLNDANGIRVDNERNIPKYIYGIKVV